MTARRLLSLLLLTGLALAACQSSGFQYVKSDEVNAIFKVPQDWRIYSEDEIVGASTANLSPSQRDRLHGSQWAVAFDSSPEPSLINVLDRSAIFPSGMARASVIQDEERDTYSLRTMRNELVNLDTLSELEGYVDPISREVITRDGGFHGLQQVVTIRTETGGFYTFNQTSLVDPLTTIAYVFVVGCEADCYEKNQQLINEVVESWTVESLDE
jgi:hypothetical protein